MSIIPGSLGLRKVLYYDKPGTYSFTKASYPWLARVRVQCQGGGGGSAGAFSDAGELIARPGAPAGAWAQSLIEVSALGTAEAVVVGKGGIGGQDNNAGGPGGTSSFGGLVSADGGDGGPANMLSGTALETARGPAGSSSGTGDIIIGGGASGASIRLSAGQCVSGRGGDSVLGRGGEERRTSGPGQPPTGYGAGAGGAVSINASPQTGQPGGSGIVIVELYG
ncbi:hypothetical protein [Streptomyces longwoodensis]|uniref:glycine-rich domain-containing protein n=1 Tax=Streptomyces longwoodensis TaxID=68231 RepID=UPI001FDF6099|nr:hypothetical protein [Streptomyces longwoodensis]